MLQHEKVLRPSYHYAEVGLKCGTLPAEKYIWHEQTIRKMLHDPTYTGAMVGNKRPTVSFQLKKRVKSSLDELVIIEDKQTHRDMLRRDVEYCLSFASSPREFGSQLYALGYTLDPVRFSVKAKHWERAVRLSSIGFSKDRVKAQLRQSAENRYRLFTLEYRPPYKPKKFPLEDELRKLGFSIEHSYDTATVLVDTVFYLVITAIQIVAELADVMLLSPDLRAAEKDLKELVADYHFLQEHGIHTVADLQANIEQSKAELSSLERERKELSNRIRRPKSLEDESKNKERRKAIGKQMKPVRERLRRAEKILEKSPHLYELLKQEHELEKKACARYKERGR